MEEVDKFKKSNGDVIYTNKELIGAIHVKMDRIEQRLIDGDKKFTKLETTSKWHTRLITGLYSIWGAILVTLLAGINYFKRIFGG